VVDRAHPPALGGRPYEEWGGGGGDGGAKLTARALALTRAD
jgi:hypothetical protein